MKIEERILCKSCGKNFGQLVTVKNCKSCEKLFRNHYKNTICRRCGKNLVTIPSDPMCYSCYTEIERKNRELIEVYYRSGVILDEKDVR